MMPDLGKYSADVLAAYGVSALCLIAIVVLSLRQSARARKNLQDAENRRKG